MTPLHPGRVRGAVAAVLAVLLLAGCSEPPSSGPIFHEAPPTTPPPPPYEGWSDPAHVFQPYGDVVQGVLTFRGNPTRTYYGLGPVPRVAPVVAWR